MGGPLSVTFSDIYKVKMENDAVIPSNTIFYHRFVYSIYSRRKLGDNALFDQLNSYPNIKLTIEVKAGKFLDTKIININGAYKFNVYRKNKHLHNGPSKLQNAIKEIQSMVVFIVQKEYHQNLTKKSLWIPPNLLTKFHKVTNNSFRMVVTWKTRN